MHIEFYQNGSFSLCDDEKELYTSCAHNYKDKLPTIENYDVMGDHLRTKRIPIEEFIKAIKKAMEQEDEDHIK